jgi:hypothetical protein
MKKALITLCIIWFSTADCQNRDSIFNHDYRNDFLVKEEFRSDSIFEIHMACEKIKVFAIYQSHARTHCCIPKLLLHDETLRPIFIANNITLNAITDLCPLKTLDISLLYFYTSSEFEGFIQSLEQIDTTVLKNSVFYDALFKERIGAFIYARGNTKAGNIHQKNNKKVVFWIVRQGDYENRYRLSFWFTNETSLKCWKIKSFKGFAK